MSDSKRGSGIPAVESPESIRNSFKQGETRSECPESRTKSTSPGNRLGINDGSRENSAGSTKRLAAKQPYVPRPKGSFNHLLTVVKSSPTNGKREKEKEIAQPTSPTTRPAPPDVLDAFPPSGKGLSYTSPSWSECPDTGDYCDSVPPGFSPQKKSPRQESGDFNGLPEPAYNPLFYPNRAPLSQPSSGGSIGSPSRPNVPKKPFDRQKSKKVKQANTKNGQTRSANQQNQVAQALAHAEADLQGQADGFHEAMRQQKEEEALLVQIEKKKKEFEVMLNRMSIRHQKNLGYFLLHNAWGADYYSESPALRALMVKFQSMGLDTQMSRKPTIVLGKVADLTKIEAPIWHLLPASIMNLPTNVMTPFYDQLIHVQYHTDILATHGQLTWADDEQAIYVADVEHRPDWMPIYRFGASVLPKTIAGQVMPGRLEEISLFADTLVRTLIKPNRTFSEMGFSASMQILLAHADRPSYVEWHYDLTNQALLSCYHDNAIMYNLRTVYGDRRHVYDDCTVETMTGVKIAGYGFSFASVVEAHNEVVVPNMDIAKQKVTVLAEQVKETLRPKEDDDEDPENPFGIYPLSDIPPIVVPIHETVLTYIQEVGHEIAKVDIFPTELPSLNSTINFENVSELYANVGQQINDHYKQFSLTFISSPADDQPPTSFFPTDFATTLNTFLDRFKSSIDHKPLYTWWSENIVALIDSTVEGILEVLALRMAGWLGVLLTSDALLEDSESPKRATWALIFNFGLLLWSKAFHSIETSLCLYAQVPQAVYFRLKDHFMAQSDIIHRLIARREMNLIPTVLLSSNYCPSLKETIPVRRQLISESKLSNYETGFYEEPMCVSWQEYQEIGPEGPQLILDHGMALEYDGQRITITIKENAPFRPGRFSEIHYGLYIEFGRCYGQNYSLTAAKKRLGRSIIRGQYDHIRRFGSFVSSCTFPIIEIVHASPCLNREEYATYTHNMPRMSRQKHMDYFDSLSDVSNSDKDKSDSFFTKSDEMIACPKGRGIINPPPSLFYDLVVGTTCIKKALKRSVFNVIYEDEVCILFLTYGADMDPAQKSAWFKKASQPLEKDRMVGYVLIGGDDNASIMHYQGEKLGWESDVSACDQSHNEDLVRNMCICLEKMGLDPQWIAILKQSYTRPINTENFRITFNEWQLHTGHPQTSTCNSLLIGLLAIYFIYLFFQNVHHKRAKWPKTAAFVSLTETMFSVYATDVGMAWKNQFHLEIEDVTFHKGCWMPCNGGLYQWVPLPSCLWKAFKIRTDQKINNKELLLRLAFNLYQKLINPNMTFVQLICQRQFNYIIRDLLDMPGPDSRYAFQQYLHSNRLTKGMQQYIESFRNAAGELTTLNENNNRETDWSQEAEQSFCQARYKMEPHDLMDLLHSDWNGSFGVLASPFLRAAIYRDYVAAHDEYADNLDEYLVTDLGRLSDCV